MSATDTTKPQPRPPASIIAEACYAMNERLGILCEGKEPTPAQVKLAEADYWRTIARWRSGELKE